MDDTKVVMVDARSGTEVGTVSAPQLDLITLNIEKNGATIAYPFDEVRCMKAALLFVNRAPYESSNLKVLCREIDAGAGACAVQDADSPYCPPCGEAPGEYVRSPSGHTSWTAAELRSTDLLTAIRPSKYHGVELQYELTDVYGRRVIPTTASAARYGDFLEEVRRFLVIAGLP